MAGSGSTQALIATFVFGIVVLAATAAIFLHVKRNGSAFLRDEPRLALVFFMTASCLWGIFGFIATLIGANTASACQVVLSFAAVFDQLARVSLEQFVLWEINNGSKLSTASLVLQAALFLRFILGAVFVGVQRPQFRPVCVAMNLVFPVGIAVVAVDALMVLVLSLWPWKLNNTLLFVTAGLGLWTGLSVPMLLGIQSTGLAIRAVLPAVGILIMIGLVTLYACSFMLPTTPPQLYLKAPSVGSLPPTEFQTRHLQNRDTSSQDDGVPRGIAGPLISRPPFGQTVEGIARISVDGKLLPPMRAYKFPIVGQWLPKKQASKKEVKNVDKLVISSPIVSETSNGNTFGKIATVDLATAAKQERERRYLVPQSIFSVGDGKRRDQQPRAMAPEELRSRMPVPKRKQLPIPVASNDAKAKVAPKRPERTTTSSVKLSPSITETQRWSSRRPLSQAANPSEIPPSTPRHDRQASDTTAALPHIATTIFVPPPRSPRRPPPISSLRIRSPKNYNTETRSLLDPRDPPPIPPRSPRRESKRLSEGTASYSSTGTVSPLVPRVQPSAMSPVEQRLVHKAADQYGTDYRNPLLPRSNSVKTSIRPSRLKPPSLPTTEDKPAKTPVQMGATTGLPKNPRARTTSAFTGAQSMAQEQTVVFINNIRGNDSLASKGIDNMVGKVKTPSPTLVRDSVIHRPRPIPRQSSLSALSVLSTSLFEKPLATPKDKRVQSKTQTSPATPASQQIPLLSPVSVRSLSGRNTNGLSPVSPSRRMIPRRTSYVPELPAVPAEYQGKQSKITQDSDIDGTTNARRTVPNGQESRVASAKGPAYRTTTQHASKFSVDTARSPDEPQSAGWPSVHSPSSCEGTIGKSSPVVLVSDDRTATRSKPFYSPTRTSESFTTKTTLKQLKTESVNDKPMAIDNEYSGTEAVPMMLDTSTSHNVSLTPRSLNREESGSADENRQRSWHRRIGEKLPTFSVREKFSRSRKLALPRPLSLNKPAKVAIIVEAEPSPLESPQQAVDKIQDQLRKFDVPNADSRATLSEQQRMTVLANLESEMGIQEFHWQKMRQDLARDSPSTVDSSPNLNSARDSLSVPSSSDPDADVDNTKPPRTEKLYRIRANASDRGSEDAEAQLVGYGTKRRSAGTMTFISVSNWPMTQIGSPTPPNTNESGDESESDGVLDFERPSDGQPTGPGPRRQTSLASGFASLDQVILNSSTPDEIAHQFEEPLESLEVPAQPAVAIPSEHRRISIDSQLKKSPQAMPDTSQADTQRSASPAGLEEHPPEHAIRPLTLRPPIRSRCVTLLPDILESPKPLTGKQDTLGIFQFPWGERSDSAAVQSQLAAMPGSSSSGRPSMDPDMNTRARTPESQDGYPATILDAYDDGGDYANNSDGSYDGDYDDNYDDGFDETTLWEIVDLLQSDKVPSRDDLLPFHEDNWEGPTLIDEASATETPSEEAEDETVYDFIPVALAPESLPTSPAQVPTLWVGNKEQTKAMKTTGLPQPGEKVWRSYLAPAARNIRARPRIEEPDMISSFSLWMNISSKGSRTSSRVLWGMERHRNISLLIMEMSEKLQKSLSRLEKYLDRPEGEQIKARLARLSSLEPKSPTTAARLLWLPPSPTKPVFTRLPQPDAEIWNAYLPPASDIVRRKHRMSDAASIESRPLWTLPSPTKAQDAQGFLWCSGMQSQTVLSPGQVDHGERATVSTETAAEDDGDYYTARNDSSSRSSTVESSNQRPMPVFMTNAQWDSAFREAIQGTRAVKKPVSAAAWATEHEWAATLNNANTNKSGGAATTTSDTSTGAALEALAKLSSSRALRDHPFFDPSLLAIVSDYIPTGATGIEPEATPPPPPLAPAPANKPPQNEDGSRPAANKTHLWSTLNNYHNSLSAPDQRSASGARKTLWQPPFSPSSDTQTL